MLIDTHCHLNDKKLLYFTPDIVQTSIEDKMKGYICIGTDIDTSVLAVKEAEIFEPIFATIGYHPDFAHEYTQEVEEN
ncbi:MAG: TatD family hydrolase [Clostridia bacterium]|nr:TatD family hydrolase [Clostridia bacterium]